MDNIPLDCSAIGIDAILERFEHDWKGDDLYLRASVEQFGLASNMEGVVELIRADIDRRYAHEREVDLKRYADWFPELRAEPRYLHDVGFEDFRSRKSRGLSLERVRWSWIPQIESCEWYREFNRATSSDRFSVRLADPSNCGSLLLEPKVGSRFGDFQLLALLGTGSFSRVFLATQQSLASRYVALKVVKRELNEPAHLARLQHTGIVPIFSVHRIGGYSVLCMPYCGSATLADWLEDSQSQRSRNGQSLISTVKQAQTRLGSSETAGSERPDDLAFAAEIDRVRLWNRGATQPLARINQLDANGCILWLARRIASALAHAHEREVVHGDLKPANVVLRSDGEPSLIDFNLARSLEDESVHIGGTLPYMSPEQLQTLLGRRLHLSASSDVYSFGMMFYQIIENHLPFPAPMSAAENDIAASIVHRRNHVSFASSHATPGLRAIIRKCLEHDLDRRYASGIDLLEDLEREAGNYPLRHAKESIVHSQIPKLVRRYPRLFSVTPILFIAGILICAVALTAVRWRNLLREREAMAMLSRWQEVIGEQLPLLIGVPESNPSEAIQKIDEQFAVIIGQSGDLQHPEMLQRLSEKERAIAGEEFYDNLLCATGLALEQRARLDAKSLQSLEQWLACGTSADLRVGSPQAIEIEALGKRAPLGVSDALVEPGDDPTHGSVEQADAEVSGAEALLKDSLWTGSMQKGPDLPQLAEFAQHSRALTGARPLLQARDLLRRNRYQLAKATLADAYPRKALRGVYWLTLGDTENRLKHLEAAQLAYSLFINEAPQAPIGFLRRIQLSSAMGDWGQAERDCSSLLRIYPRTANYYAERARIREQLGRVDEAVSDLDQAIALEATNRFYLFRSRLKQSIDAQQSKEDFILGIRQTPRSVDDWISRALAQLPRFPDKALADLKQAESIDPLRFEVLQNMAHIYSEHLHDPDSAIQALGKIVDTSENVWARVDRCVLLARTGQHQLALQEIDSILNSKSSPSASTFYQLACAHAWLISHRPASQDDAIRCLATAIMNGYGRELIQSDKDLDPLRRDPRFQALTEVSRLQRENARHP